jgi:NAD(P)-dependent dehydrogenase (short-subunit alcohol dehydrogenase family)
MFWMREGNMRRFDGKVVLVTGAASGIGRAVALRLAGEGAVALLADRDRDGLAATADAIRAADGEARVHPYDAALPGDDARMVADAVRDGGQLDAVLNIAGIYRRAHFASIAAAEWDLILRVNLTSVFEICRAALPYLVAARGCVVNTASTAGVRGIAYAAPYAAAKAGVIALTASLAAEVAHLGVRANVVAPGRVRTALSAGLVPLEGTRPGLAVHPAKLRGMEDGAEPTEVAGVYAFLASADAAYVSGTVTVADGAHGAG